MIKKEKGFSLAGVMVAAGILGGLALVSMRIMDNMQMIQLSSQSKFDEIELSTSIRLILSNPKYCRISLAGDGPSGTPTSPVTFNKVDIDEDDEGLDIALYQSNQAGDTRSLKKFNGENFPDGDDKSKFGSIKIKSMKLIMNINPGTNYSDSPSDTDGGIIRAVLQKKISSSKTRDIIKDFDINVEMSTTGGLSTILSCASSASSASTANPAFTVKNVRISSNDFHTSGSNWKTVTPKDSFSRTATCPDIAGKTFISATCTGSCLFSYCQNPPSFCSKAYRGVIYKLGNPLNDGKSCELGCSAGSSLAVYGNWVTVNARCLYLDD